MKYAVLAGLLLFLLTGCSDFYHLQYRHLDKIPAKGEIAPRVQKDRSLPFHSSAKDSVPLRSETVIADTLAKENNAKENDAVGKKEMRAVAHPSVKLKTHEKFSSPDQRAVHPRSGEKRRGRAVLRVLLVLMSGFMLMLLGMTIAVYGFFATSLLLAVLGLGTFLLGSLPYTILCVSVLKRLVGRNKRERIIFREPAKKMC